MTYHPYLIHDQKSVVENLEIDDLCPLSYAETSRSTENHPFFRLSVLGG
jgi:hypothetical protein